MNATHNNNREHRLDLLHSDRDNKENNKQNAAATFLTNMEYQNLNKVSTHIQNYVKDIINKYYAETPLMYPAMPTPTETAHESQQPAELQAKPASSQRKRMLSETEEYIEYLRNKEDITLTITPKVGSAQKQRHTSTSQQSNQQRQSPARQALLATPAVTLAPIAPIMPQPQPMQTLQPQPAQTQPQSQKPPSKRRKSLSQIATLLPLLADAASQQQYLTAPLDFSKKPTHADEATAAPKTTPTSTAQPAVAVLPKAAQVSVIQAAPTQPQQPNTGVQSAANDKRSSRKQAQPKKIRAPPEVIVAMLRDKYLNRMVDHKLSCRACAQDKRRAAAMLVFNYHTKGSLALHKHWKHRAKKQRCGHCMQAFKQSSSLIVHTARAHPNVVRKQRRGVKKVCDKLKKQQKKGDKQQRRLAKKCKKTALRT